MELCRLFNIENAHLPPSKGRWYCCYISTLPSTDWKWRYNWRGEEKVGVGRYLTLAKTNANADDKKKPMQKVQGLKTSHQNLQIRMQLVRDIQAYPHPLTSHARWGLGQNKRGETLLTKANMLFCGNGAWTNIAEEPKSPNMKTLGMIGVVCEANIRSWLLKTPDIKRTIRADGWYASIHTK